MSEDAHALLSASGSHRWATCAASLRLEAPLPRTSSKYAAEGTCAHTLGSWALENGKDCQDYPEPTISADGFTFPVNSEMIKATQVYVDHVRERAKGASLLVEQKVNYSSWLGIDAKLGWGTSDAVVLFDEVLEIWDLKYGMGVKVDAESNEQLMLYALGCLYEYEHLGEFRSVVVGIVQPRLDHISEHSIPVTDLKEFALRMSAAARKALRIKGAPSEPVLADFMPSDGACRFCGVKATCPALAADVEHETRDLFAALVENGASAMAAAVPEDRLAQAMSKVDLIEGFCKAIRAETERRLLAGQSVEGYKLVEGRRGPRSWTDEAAAEKLLESMRLKVEERYDFKVKSPTSIEKILKDNPRKWTKVHALITQTDGKPSVAPVSDKRPAMKVNGADALAALSSAEDLV